MAGKTHSFLDTFEFCLRKPKNVSCMSGFPWRLTSERISNNRLLFKNNRPLFSFCFLEIFAGAGQGYDGE